RRWSHTTYGRFCRRSPTFVFSRRHSDRLSIGAGRGRNLHYFSNRWRRSPTAGAERTQSPVLVRWGLDRLLGGTSRRPSLWSPSRKDLSHTYHHRSSKANRSTRHSCGGLPDLVTRWHSPALLWQRFMGSARSAFYLRLVGVAAGWRKGYQDRGVRSLCSA